MIGEGALGDRVGRRQVLIVVEPTARAPAFPPLRRTSAALPLRRWRPTPPACRRRSGSADVEYDMVVPRRRPGGFRRLPRRRPGPQDRIIERYATLGGVPERGLHSSKALLHVAR